MMQPPDKSSLKPTLRYAHIVRHGSKVLLQLLFCFLLSATAKTIATYSPSLLFNIAIRGAKRLTGKQKFFLLNLAHVRNHLVALSLRTELPHGDDNLGQTQPLDEGFQALALL